MPDNDVFDQVKALLSQSPGGLTLADISRHLRMHRNSLSRYMEVLQARGEVEHCTFGNTRVFFLTKRIPLSSFLLLTSDLVCMVDDAGCLVNANHRFLEFFTPGRESITGAPLDEIRTCLAGSPTLMDLFGDFIDKDELTRDISLSLPGGGSRAGDFSFRVKGIPTVFDGGGSGKTIWMEDITTERNYVRNLEFLARTSAELADMDEHTDIFGYIVERIRELEPESFVGVSSLDQDAQTLTIKRVAMAEEEKRYFEACIGRPLEGITFPVSSEPGAEGEFSKKVLVEAPKLYHIFFRQIPEALTDSIEGHLSMGKGYFMGCVCRGGVFGDVVIKLKKGSELSHRETIEAFLSQAAIALQRRHMRAKLMAAEERIRQIERQCEQ